MVTAELSMPSKNAEAWLTGVGGSRAAAVQGVAKNSRMLLCIAAAGFSTVCASTLKP